MSFLDDSGSSSGSEVEGGGKASMGRNASQRGDDDKLQVNRKFAETFNQRKREQELQAAKHLDLGSDGEEESGSESDSETEDEDAEMLTTALDLQIMKTINKIRSKDPDIYNAEKEWFKPEDGADDVAGDGSKKTEKRMRYKDVVREQILRAETAEDAISSDEEDSDGGDDGRSSRNGRGGEGRRGLAYDEEQERLRKGFLGSVAEHDGSKDGGNGGDEGGDDSEEEGDGLLKIRSKTPAEMAEEEELLKKEAEKMVEQGDGGEEDAFLKDFVGNRRWLDPLSKETPSYDEILKAPHVEDSEDEEDIDKADHFESKYNFRFEEEGGGEIAMHSRNVEGSMRRKDDRRKRERENRRVRKAEERKRKEVELRRLKNLKREEIRKRLKAIQDMSGGALLDDVGGEGGGRKGGGRKEGGPGDAVDAQALIDGDFDPQQWDDVTGKAFGDEYYEAEDADDGWKPGDDPLEGLGDLDKYNNADESAGADDGDGPNGYEDDGAGDDIEDSQAAGAASSWGEGGQGGDEEEGGEEEGWEGEEGDWDGEEEGEEDGEEFAGMGAQKERLLDELYKLDYEDIVADVPCRFKYTKVKSNDFGLTAEEILLADDKDLNRYVPLKKLAPYRSDEPKLDARRRRKLREEVKEREAAAEAEMMALRLKKRRRGKKKGGGASADAGAAGAAGAAASNGTPTGAGGEGTAAAETGLAEEGGTQPEPAGGKRRRRKKGQKKKRAKAGGGDNGEGVDGQAEADLVPRVVPMEPPQQSSEAARNGIPATSTSNGGGGGGGGEGGGSRKKKRRRSSGGGGGGGGGGMAEEDPKRDGEDGRRAAGKDGAEQTDEKAAARNRGSEEAGVSVKKARKAGRDGRTGENKVERERKPSGKGPGKRKGDRGSAAVVPGVSKSRLASYGL